MSKLKVIESNISISNAWEKAFLSLYDKKGKREFSPLIISVIGFTKDMEIPEDYSVKELLDKTLSKRGESSIQTVANTIFPWLLWNPNKNRQKLYDRHDKILPSINTCDLNNRGHYFRRMIDYKNGEKKINQLEKVISIGKTNFRHSGMQVSLFDPRKDHIPQPYLKFPCLHQVSFDMYGPKGRDGLGVTGFYGTQNILRKAYGNYLGLARLGKFIAHELGIEFVRLNCIAGKATFKDLKKSDPDIIELVKFLRTNEA